MGGSDTIVFHAGEANGDTVFDFDVVIDFDGNMIGDVLNFVGYGTAADGATVHRLNATDWEITSADGTITDVIHILNSAVVTLAGAPTIDAGAFVFL